MKFEDLTRSVIGGAMEVHRTLGNGLPELIYQQALGYELELRGIQFAREFDMPIYYKGIQVGSRRVDFFIDGKIMVELKAFVRLESAHLAQGINYLEVSNLEVGLLINFGGPSLEFKRLLNPHFRKNNP